MSEVKYRSQNQFPGRSHGAAAADGVLARV